MIQQQGKTLRETEILLKRKFRAKDIDTDFRNVEFQRLVEYPG